MYKGMCDKYVMISNALCELTINHSQCNYLKYFCSGINKFVHVYYVI